MLIKFGGNRKMSKGKVGYLSMPADPIVCGRACLGCYAKRVYPVVIASRWVNYKASCKSKEFKATLKAELAYLMATKKIAALRLHDSGEFHSQDYVDSLTEVLAGFPTLKVYGFTKRMQDFDFSKLMALPNVVVIDSLKFGKLNYGDDECIADMIKLGAHLCRATKDHSVSCNNGCDYCLTKEAVRTGVVFVKH